MPALFSPDTFILVSAPLTSAGAGYTSVPSVNVTGTNGEGAAITAVLTPAAVNATFTVVSGGRGYAIAPRVRLMSVDGNGTGATATCAITAGAVSSVTLGAAGTGYTQPPLVAFDVSGDGTGAAATSLLVGTTVASLRVMRGGQGYSQTPSVILSGGGFTTAATCLVPVISSLSTVSVPRSAAKQALNKAPLIQASAWPVSTIVAVNTYFRHTNGQLMLCVVAGTTGATIPTWSSVALMGDNTASWAAAGRMSRVNTDGADIPTVTTSSTIPAGTADTQILNNQGRVLTPSCQNIVSNQGGNTSAAWQIMDGFANNAQGIGVGMRGALRTTVFRTDAPLMAISTWNNPGLYIKVYVDDYPLQESPTPLVAGTPAYYIVNWNGVRREREYRVECAAGQNLRGVCVGTQDSLYAPLLSGPLGVWSGDSIGTTVSTYGTVAFEKLNQRVARLLGIRYMRDFSMGGTGYIATSSGTASAANTTFVNNPQVDWSAADVVFIFHGINDAGQSVPAITAAALATWQTVRLQYPNAVIIVGETWNGGTGPSATLIAISAALQASFTAWADPLSGFVRCLSEGWVTGTGKWGTTTGTGNSDFYTGSDGTHPSQPGAELLAMRTAAAAEAILASFGR